MTDHGPGCDGPLNCTCVGPVSYLQGSTFQSLEAARAEYRAKGPDMGELGVALLEVADAIDQHLEWMASEVAAGR